MARGWPKPTRWRKKPVEIEAMGPLTHDNSAGIAYWCGGAVNRRLDEVLVRTLEGEMLASLGDYVIRGVKGEFYPCKPDIFDATYERVWDVEPGECGYCSGGPATNPGCPHHGEAT